MVNRRNEAYKGYYLMWLIRRETGTSAHYTYGSLIVSFILTIAPRPLAITNVHTIIKAFARSAGIYMPILGTNSLS